MRYDAFPAVVLVIFFALVVGGCGDDVTEPDDGQVTIEESDGLDPANIPANEGTIGLIVDTREIFKQGYTPTRVEISFNDQSEFDTNLDVDPWTNLAILYIENDDLTVEQQSAFAEGVATSIVVYGGTQSLAAYGGPTGMVTAKDSEQELARFEEQIAVDDSNRPYSISTELPQELTPNDFIDELPYLLHPEGGVGFLTSGIIVDYLPSWQPHLGVYEIELSNQHFYFDAVSGEENTYLIRHQSWYWAWHPSGLWVYLTDNVDLASEFVREQHSDGWVRLRAGGTTDQYLFLDRHVMRVVPEDQASNWRLLADQIEWELQDLGTTYNQPIMPATQVDFAYQTRISNCSAAQVTETIGRAQSRTVVSTYEYSEALQLFSSEELSASLMVHGEIQVSFTPPGPTGGPGGHVRAGFELTAGYKYTTSQSESWEEQWTSSTSETVEVSRTREIVVPPYSAIKATDVIRSVENVRIPWTQQLRLRGRFRDSGRSLTGTQLETQYRSNLGRGLITNVGAGYLDLTLRGVTWTDGFFQAESIVTDDGDGCGQ